MASLSTTISTVTVYPNRARITRRGTTSLEAGLQQLVIEELPLQMVRESLRTSARGTAHARLLGAQVQIKHYAETPVEVIRQLEGQIETLQEEIKKLDIQLELIQKQREALDEIAGHSDKFALALASGEMKVEQELAIFAKLRAQSEELENETLGVQRKHRHLEDQLQKLSKDLDQLRSSRPRQRHAAVIEVEMRTAGELTIELSYVVQNARWKPIYDLRLVEEQTGSQCEVTYMAQVTQATGEHWEGVQLALSTARPAQSQALPDLQPWYVQPPSVEPVAERTHTYRAAPAALASKAVLEDAKAPLMSALSLQEAEIVTAEVDTSGSTVTYNVPNPANIPPDGTAHKVTVARFRLAPKLDYLCAPRLNEAVFRRAIIKNDSAYTLLAGEASLFVNQEFVGTTPLELTAPQGEIEIALGVEDRIKVERELKRREVDKRMISNRRHQVYGYELRVENLLPARAELKLHDQIPVARHEEIKVKLESCEPKPAEQTELNLLKWELSLEAGEKHTLRFDFSVDCPQGMNVVGLP